MAQERKRQGGANKAPPVQLLDADDVATLLKVTRKTVYELTHASKLRSVRVGVSGRLVRFRPADVAEYQEQGLQE